MCVVAVKMKVPQLYLQYNILVPWLIVVTFSYAPLALALYYVEYICMDHFFQATDCNFVSLYLYMLLSKYLLQ